MAKGKADAAKIIAAADLSCEMTLLAHRGDAHAQDWVMNRFCAAYIQRAKAGEGKAGKWLLKQFCAAVKSNRRKARDGKLVPHNKPSGIHTQFPEELLDYLSDAFAKILDGVAPDRALGIVNQSGRPEVEFKLDRDVTICEEILKLKKSGKYTTIEHCKAMAARTLKLGRATIDAGWKNRLAKAIAIEHPGANR
jgi:hypothetical protein